MSSSFTIHVHRGQGSRDHLAKMYFCQKWLFWSAVQRHLAAVTVKDIKWRVRVVDVWDGFGPDAFLIMVQAAAHLEPQELDRAEKAVNDVLGMVREDAPFLLDVKEPDTKDIRALRLHNGVYFFHYTPPSTPAGPGPRGKMIKITYFDGNTRGRDVLKQALEALGSRAATVAPRRSPQRVALAAVGTGVGGRRPLNEPPVGPTTSMKNGFGLLDMDDSDDDSDDDGKTEEEDNESDDDEEEGCGMPFIR